MSTFSDVLQKKIDFMRLDVKYYAVLLPIKDDPPFYKSVLPILQLGMIPKIGKVIKSESFDHEKYQFLNFLEWQSIFVYYEIAKVDNTILNNPSVWSVHFFIWLWGNSVMDIIYSFFSSEYFHIWLSLLLLLLPLLHYKRDALLTIGVAFKKPKFKVSDEIGWCLAVWSWGLVWNFCLS